MAEIFLSYAGKDQTMARRAHQKLAHLGHHVWVDWEQILTGECWKTRARAGIDSSRILAFIISQNSLLSRNCQLELLYAMQRSKDIVVLTPRWITGLDKKKASRNRYLLYKQFQSLETIAKLTIQHIPHAIVYLI